MPYGVNLVALWGRKEGSSSVRIKKRMARDLEIPSHSKSKTMYLDNNIYIKQNERSQAFIFQIHGFSYNR